jgi:hypothetical protein
VVRRLGGGRPVSDRIGTIRALPYFGTRYPT